MYIYICSVFHVYTCKNHDIHVLDQAVQVGAPTIFPPVDLSTSWDDPVKGEWEAPMIDNPEYKGEWTVKRISNPAYKGVWEAKKIANPEFVDTWRVAILVCPALPPNHRDDG